MFMFQFTTRSGNIFPKNMFHCVNQGKTKVMYISDIKFLKLCLTDFCKRNQRFSKNLKFLKLKFVCANLLPDFVINANKYVSWL